MWKWFKWLFNSTRPKRVYEEVVIECKVAYITPKPAAPRKPELVVSRTEPLVAEVNRKELLRQWVANCKEVDRVYKVLHAA